MSELENVCPLYICKQESLFTSKGITILLDFYSNSLNKAWNYLLTRPNNIISHFTSTLSKPLRRVFWFVCMFDSCKKPTGIWNGAKLGRFVKIIRYPFYCACFFIANYGPDNIARI